MYNVEINLIKKKKGVWCIKLRYKILTYIDVFNIKINNIRTVLFWFNFSLVVAFFSL